MVWYRAISQSELIFIALFLVFYAAYIYRIVSVARNLKTSYSAVFVKLFIRTIYFGLFIISLLGPSFGESTKEIKSVGKDIMIAVDLSQSMNAFDVPPTRLEKVKFELKKITAEFSSDRIGIIIFSSEAFVQCPLTYDQNALQLFIETLHSGLVPRTGTDFAPALGLALEKLEDKERSSLDQKSKAIILISDGEDFGDESLSLAEEIQDRGIKLFTLGVGTERGSKIRSGRAFKKDNNGVDVVTKLDNKGLKGLAAKTGGQYFEVTDSRNDVARLINTINSLEGELRDTRQVDVSANKYVYFLGLAFLLLLLDLFTSVKTIKI